MYAKDYVVSKYKGNTVENSSASSPSAKSSCAAPHNPLVAAGKDSRRRAVLSAAPLFPGWYFTSRSLCMET
ncbi:hypothetical protein GOP47_0029272 [Adiantum capillus-veneris]|nr:hypothetical protein GOP47_0029272 [Adiantum capillus-veneris]